jgi:hypothetical protein
VIALLGMVGCATSRSARVGMVADDQVLVTLVVSEERSVVERECSGVRAAGPILGCHMTRFVSTPEEIVRVVKIVRYTDSLPSQSTLEIDAHELCHMVAAFQHIKDPCHAENGGVLQARQPSSAAHDIHLIRPAAR